MWRSNVFHKIRVPDGMGSTHEIRLIDMNNAGDVLLKVNYVGKVDPLTVKPQVLDKVYIRYANGTLRQVATPDWACPDCIWPEKIDDTATVYGYLKQDHAFDESISFSWKEGVYDFFALTPPAEALPPFVVCESHPSCHTTQIAVVDEGVVTCIGEDARQAKLYRANSIGQIFGSIETDSNHREYYIWTLDMRTPQNALEAFTAKLNELLLQDASAKDLLSVSSTAKGALRGIQQNNNHVFCHYYRKIGVLIGKGATDKTSLVAPYDRLTEFVGTMCS